MRMMLTGLFSLTAVLLGTAWARAADLLVPASYPTIQGAIAAAQSGDRVLVSAGTYNETLNLGGKSIQVIGVEGATVTIIDRASSDRCLVANSGETASSLVKGFTLRGGRATEGGGAYVQSSLRVEGCTFISNNAVRHPSAACNDTGVARGGAVRIAGGQPLFRECTFALNSATSSGPASAGPRRAFGGAISIASAIAQFIDCNITGNNVSAITPHSSDCPSSASGGGGLHIESGSADLLRCSIVGNSATAGNFYPDNTIFRACYGGGILNYGLITLTNCSLRNNSALLANFGTSNLGGGGLYSGGQTVLQGTMLCANTPQNLTGAYADLGSNQFSSQCGAGVCLGDTNGDGRVDGEDLATVLSAWGNCP